jgi:hypothetical protein
VGRRQQEVLELARGKKDEKKKRPAVRLPVAPPTRPHKAKAEYRRGQEKERFRREVQDLGLGEEGDTSS